MADANALVRTAPDFELLEHLLAGCDAVSLYVAWHDGASHARARMFTRLVEGGEDSATWLGRRCRCARISPGPAGRVGAFKLFVGAAGE